MKDDHPRQQDKKGFWNILKNKFNKNEKNEDVKEPNENVKEAIIRLVDSKVGDSDDCFDGYESTTIKRYMLFLEKEVKQVMQSKESIVSLDYNMTVEEAFGKCVEEAYSRFPVYGERNDNIDGIEGILHIKNLARAYFEPELRKKTLKEVQRLHEHDKNPEENQFLFPVHYTHETKRASELMHSLMKQRGHMSLVRGEFATIEGIITMEDLLEEIFGEIADEYDTEIKEPIKRIKRGEYEAEGMAFLDDLSLILGMDFDLEDIDNINGFLVHKIGRLPNEEDIGRKIKYQNYIFEILSIENLTVTKVKIYTDSDVAKSSL